jgi:hypothetical protein
VNGSFSSLSISRAAVPAVAALVAAALGLVNLFSALTPNAHWRGHVLVQVEPIGAMHVFHALAVPASVALLVGALAAALVCDAWFDVIASDGHDRWFAAGLALVAGLPVASLAAVVGVRSVPTRPD